MTDSNLKIVYTIIRTLPHVEDRLTVNLDLTEVISSDNELNIPLILKRLNLMNDVIIRKLKKLFHSSVPERQIQGLTEYLIVNFPEQVKNYRNLSNDTAIDLVIDILDKK